MEVADQAEAEIAVPLAVVTVDHRAAVGETEVPEAMVLEMVDEDVTVVVEAVPADRVGRDMTGQEVPAMMGAKIAQGVIALTAIGQRKVRNWKPKPLKRFPMAFSF